MARTRARPTVMGTITTAQVLILSGAVGGLGLAILWHAVNPLTMWLTLATFVGYAIVYTVRPKPATPQNIVIGGASGAMPPVLGWAAVAGEVTMESRTNLRIASTHAIHLAAEVVRQVYLSAGATAVFFLVAAALFGFIGAYAPPAFLAHFTVFVLACFVGYMVIWNVTPALHTPLMSVTNAISSIIAVGALIQIAPPLDAAAEGRPDVLILGLAVAALSLTAVNMFGGFAVTRRMLAMFRK